MAPSCVDLKEVDALAQKIMQCVEENAGEKRENLESFKDALLLAYIRLFGVDEYIYLISQTQRL